MFFSCEDNKITEKEKEDSILNINKDFKKKSFGFLLLFRDVLKQENPFLIFCHVKKYRLNHIGMKYKLK